MTGRRLVALLACFSLLSAQAQQSTLLGNKLSLTPTTLPTFCSTGDFQVKPTNGQLYGCINGTWAQTGSGGSDPTTTLGDTVYNDGAALARLAGNTASSVFFFSQTGNGTVSAAPAWFTASNTGGISNLVLRDGSGNISVTPGNFLGNLIGNVSGTASQAGTASFATSATTASNAGVAAFASTASSAGTAAFATTSGTASTSGTAAFAALSGTASAATAFVATPTGCSAGQYAQFIAPNGNLTCAIVTTASSAGTAAFAAIAGTASAATAFTVTPSACAAGVWANAIGPNGNLTCAIVSTASTSGTASGVTPGSMVLDPTADSPANKEMFELNRTGGSAGAGVSNRASWLTFHDASNPTYLGAMACFREAPNINFAASCALYVNATSASAQTGFATLTKVLTLANNGNIVLPKYTTAGILSVNASGTVSITTVAATQGGTGLNATPASGTLMFGDGTTWQTGSIVAGSNMTATFGGGNMTLSAAGGTSFSWNFLYKGGVGYTAAANDWVNFSAAANGTVTLGDAQTNGGKTIFVRYASVTDFQTVSIVTTNGQTMCNFGTASVCSQNIKLRTLGEVFGFVADGSLGIWYIYHHAVNGDWQPYTPSISVNFGTPAAVSFFYQRVDGRNLHVRGKIGNNTLNNASPASVGAPAGCSIDMTVVSSTPMEFSAGTYWHQQGGAFGANSLFGAMGIDTADTANVYFSKQGTNSTFEKTNVNAIGNNTGQTTFVDFIIPCQGFLP